MFPEQAHIVRAQFLPPSVVANEPRAADRARSSGLYQLKNRVTRTTRSVPGFVPSVAS